MTALASIMRSPLLVRSCRVLVGLIMLAAALSKIGDAGSFARQIGHYDVVPIGLIHLLAITLPWVELLAGLALVLGVHARSGAWLALAMVVVFTVMVAQAMARGLDIECGCFGTADATKVGTGKLIESFAIMATGVVASLRRR